VNTQPKLGALAAFWEREAYYLDGRQRADLPDADKRVSEMHARVLRACAADLRRYEASGGLPDRGRG
jgi:hypothetical protein